MCSKAACANPANRIRVSAQLVEAETGNHIWAERYDRDLIDMFGLQDEITEAVTIAVAPAIADAEQHRPLRKPPSSLDAWAPTNEVYGISVKPAWRHWRGTRSRSMV